MAAARGSKKKKGEVGGLLTQATVRLEAGDGEAALTLLLLAWQRARLAPITALVDQLTARLLVEPIEPLADQQKRFLLWCERAKAKRAADVGPMLAEFQDALDLGKTRSYFIRGRIKVLRALPPDPRVGRFLQGLMAHDVSNDLLQGAKRHIDPEARVKRILNSDALIQAQLRVRATGITAEDLAPQLALLEETIARVALEPVPPVINDAPGLESDEAMLAAVYANPKDDALRQIYADRLIELGDPRGEFITLQFQKAAKTISPEGSRREAALLKKHSVEWLGGLAPFVIKASAEFEKGFLSSVSCNCKRVYEARQAFDFAEWSTVKDVRFDKTAFITPAMKSLEIAGNVGEFGISMMLEIETMPPLKGLSLHLSSAQGKGHPRTWRWVSMLPRLTQLKSLIVLLPWASTATPASVVEAIAEQLPASVTDLALDRLANTMGDVFERNRAIEEGLAAAPAQLRRFEIEGFAFERYEGQWQRAHRRR